MLSIPYLMDEDPVSYHKINWQNLVSEQRDYPRKLLSPWTQSLGVEYFVSGDSDEIVKIIPNDL